MRDKHRPVEETPEVKKAARHKEKGLKPAGRAMNDVGRNVLFVERARVSERKGSLSEQDARKHLSRL